MPLPLYTQVKEAIRREIETAMRPGDLLQPEPALEQRFGVSRITVRRALDELVAEGLITRKQGKGTFVREPRLTQDLARLMSWTRSIRQMGHEPSTAYCEIERVEAPAEMAAMLGTPSGGKVIRVFRLRLVDGQPLCFMTNYIPDGLVPGLEEVGLVNDSVYTTLEARGLRPTRAEDTVEARPANEWEAQQLAVATRSALLQVTRLASDSDGRPLYVAVVASRGDQYSYRISFGG
jgi:GntR family transcriptional regulator